MKMNGKETPQQASEAAGKQIFISFSSKDQHKADQIVDFLENNGYKCFISSRDLIAGREYAGQLIDNITSSTVVVLLLSKTSNESPHVLREVESAVSRKIPVIVYKLEEVTLSKSMEYYLMTHQWIQIGDDQNFRLLKGLNNIGIERGSRLTEGSDKTDANKKKRSISMTAVIIAVSLVIVAGIVVLAVGISKNSDKNQGEAETTKAAEAVNSAVNTDEQDTRMSENSGEQTGGVEDNENSSSGSVVSGTSAEPVQVKDLELGQVVSFGDYLEAPIEWIVLKADNDTYTLVSRYILSLKCFDAAEGGEYGYYEGVDYFSYANHIITDPALTVKVRGNNDWSRSNLRTWLNSDNGIVKYEDQAPCLNAVYGNPYDFEAGFLKDFSEAERNSMVAATVTTTVNGLNEEAVDGKITTTDYVYLLSTEELKYFEDIDMHIYTKPTEEAIAQNKNNEGYSSFAYDYETENYMYWLRDNDPEDYANMAYIAVTEVHTGMQYTTASVGACTYGVRPVITVKKEYFGTKG